MADVATIDVSALTVFGERLDAARAALAGALEAANEAITPEVESALSDLYGARLAPLWQTETSVGEGGAELASVRVSTDDKRVLFYEYGTRPHLIAARSARVLSFPWRGAQAFYAHVHHPGTPAHSHREALKIAVGMAAREAWSAAIQEALTAA